MSQSPFPGGITATASGPAGTEFLTGVASRMHRARAAEDQWRERLQQTYDIAATHPENGWVTRTAPLQIVLSDVSYCRPDLNPGDLIAIGAPGKWRLVRLREKISVWPSLCGSRPTETWSYSRISRKTARKTDPKPKP